MKAMISRLRLSPILLIGCLFVLPGTTARATVPCSDPIYVDASVAGIESGGSWGNAMTSLRDGLAAAACGSTVGTSSIHRNDLRSSLFGGSPSRFSLVSAPLWAVRDQLHNAFPGILTMWCKGDTR